ncbi:unnamed protein product [Prunus armeniaca]|uniref:Uncharacterized protein n=1 Tax=Prunus armeniaca TaxID=36596 RepID=A0A6J5W4A8_PRUAR|nr:unnamed protein product [Prunus armeniaca]
MSWDFKALDAPHPSYGFTGIVGEVVLQAKHVLAMSAFNKVKASAFNKAKVLGGRDRMSMTEIDNMVRELGYDELNDDQDVIDILVFVLETRLIDIFLYHGVDGNEEADIVPNRGVVIEELDDNYEAIVPGQTKGGRGMEKPRESCARQGVSEKGKEKAVEKESSVVQKDKEKAVERESSATVDKGKSKVSYVFGKRKARAFVTKGVVEKEVVEGSRKEQVIKMSSNEDMKSKKQDHIVMMPILMNGWTNKVSGLEMEQKEKSHSQQMLGLNMTLMITL